MTTATDEGLAPVGPLRLYWRSLGGGGTPLVVVHGDNGPGGAVPVGRAVRGRARIGA